MPARRVTRTEATIAECARCRKIRLYFVNPAATTTILARLGGGHSLLEFGERGQYWPRSPNSDSIDKHELVGVEQQPARTDQTVFAHVGNEGAALLAAWWPAERQQEAVLNLPVQVGARLPQSFGEELGLLQH